MEKEQAIVGASAGDEPPGTIVECEAQGTWQRGYSHSIKDIEELSKRIPISDENKATLQKVSEEFHLRITDYYLSLIKDPSDAKDPIYMQCVPSPEEIKVSEHDSIDPLGEVETEATPFLVHRYPDRVLFLVTGKCFMYCRHCTRKRLWKCGTAEPGRADIDEAVAYIKKNREIREVVISGGDPLTLNTEKLRYILSSVSKVRTVDVMRVGTRTPVVFPERIDDELCDMLEGFEKLWMNVQFNHSREITPQAIRALRRLQKCGIPVSNQSVLLKGINDDPKVMKDLCQKLQKVRVRPYYIFQCDPVVGAAHFRTSVFKGMEIIEKMRGHTSGMCVPTFVVDGIDGRGKVPIMPNYITSVTEKSLILRNYENEVFEYHNPA
ncbi:MAG: KamA family radical SAM protein [Candidatus Omnitrophica bacterium]|nr:KamA family radical SAM protein [Candidatus Omnitrophota bacterium]